jgi:hypothetical protein
VTIDRHTPGRQVRIRDWSKLSYTCSGSPAARRQIVPMDGGVAVVAGLAPDNGVAGEAVRSEGDHLGAAGLVTGVVQRCCTSLLGGGSSRWGGRSRVGC